LLGTTLALLKPIPPVPAEESAVDYAYDAIAWQFDSSVCNRVVSSKDVMLGMAVAECDSGERFLVIATSVSGNGQLSAAMRFLTNSSILRQVADEKVRLLAPHQFWSRVLPAFPSANEPASRLA
jgi:hypothetical protein